MTIVWLLEDEDAAPLASELRELARQDVKVSFTQPAPKQGQAMNQGFERLVHLLRGVKIGVALGGGAARGMSHLGVLKALATSGIIVDAITVDLISGQAVVRDTGDAVRGIIESINLPVLSLPIHRDGQALVDGGLINNVPADVLVKKGCNFVIAVSVTAKMELEFAHNRPDTPTIQMKRASTLQTVLRSYLVQSTNINAIGVQPADIVIEPDVTAFDLTAFKRTDELAEVGEQATVQAIPKIRELLAQLDGKLFARSSQNEN